MDDGDRDEDGYQRTLRCDRTGEDVEGGLSQGVGGLLTVARTERAFHQGNSQTGIGSAPSLVHRIEEHVWETRGRTARPNNWGVESVRGNDSASPSDFPGHRGTAVEDRDRCLCNNL